MTYLEPNSSTYNTEYLQYDYAEITSTNFQGATSQATAYQTVPYQAIAYSDHTYQYQACSPPNPIKFSDYLPYNPAPASQTQITYPDQAHPNQIGMQDPLSYDDYTSYHYSDSSLTASTSSSILAISLARQPTIIKSRIWSPKETSKLIELVEKYWPKNGPKNVLKNWNFISCLLNTNKTANQCKQKWHKLQIKEEASEQKHIESIDWTHEEDTQMMDLVGAYETDNIAWEDIAPFLNRTPEECECYWYLSIVPQLPEEERHKYKSTKALLEYYKSNGITFTIRHRSTTN